MPATIMCNRSENAVANVFKDILNKLNLTDDEDDFEDEGYDWGEKPAKKGKRIIEEED